MTTNGYQMQLCWDCRHAVRDGVCPWSMRYEPVEGWDAKPSKRMTGSYEIVGCPLFESDVLHYSNKGDFEEYTLTPKMLREMDEDLARVAAGANGVKRLENNDPHSCQYCEWFKQETAIPTMGRCRIRGQRFSVLGTCDVFRRKAALRGENDADGRL